MIGIESLLRTLEIKENLNDQRSLRQITELLRPIEYTRVDKLIDVVFYTSQDVSNSDEPAAPETTASEEPSKVGGLSSTPGKHASPVNFYEKCVARVSRKLGKNLIKDGRVTYTSADKETHLVLLNSKTYPDGDGRGFWYGFRPNQGEFLEQSKSSFVAFGCGSEEEILLIPFSKFKKFLRNLPVTTEEDGGITHSHVIIHNSDSRFHIRIGEEYEDITQFAI
jgi:hypothetical protein